MSRCENVLGCDEASSALMFIYVIFFKVIAKRDHPRHLTDGNVGDAAARFIFFFFFMVQLELSTEDVVMAASNYNKRFSSTCWWGDYRHLFKLKNT